MATNKPQHEYMKTALRLPNPLHAKLHEVAAIAGRSYNAEIVARLESSFAESDEWEALSQAKRAETELMLRGSIQQLVQECASLALGSILIHDWLREEGELDASKHAQIVQILDRAKAALERASRAQPERLIDDLRAAVNKTEELAAKLSPKWAAAIAARIEKSD